MSFKLCLSILILIVVHCIQTEEEEETKSCNIAGIHPSDCPKYALSDTYFFCGGNKDKKIPIKLVNDDYCDCIETGDDEPGTSACNHGRFYCANKGYRGRYIFSSLVGDGLCDCCDGSDEYGNDRVQCPNNCREKAQEEMSDILAEKKKFEQGIKVKHSLIAVAKSKLNEKQSQKEQIVSDLSTKRDELAQKEEIKKLVEEKEQNYKAEKKKRADEEREKKEREAKDLCKANGGTDCDDVKIDKKVEREESPRERRRRERRERHQKRLDRRQRRMENLKVSEGESEKEEFPYPEQYRPHDEEDETSSDIAGEGEEEFPYPEQYRPHDENEEVAGGEEGDGFDWSEFDDDEEEEEDDSVPEEEEEEKDEVMDDLRESYVIFVLYDVIVCHTNSFCFHQNK